MELLERKKRIVEVVETLENEASIAAFERLIEDTFQNPFSTEEIKQRIQLAESDIDTGKVYTVDQVLAGMKTWKQK